MRQGIEIKRGAFGLGAFATTAIFPNDYLGGAQISRVQKKKKLTKLIAATMCAEYVGELFTENNTPNMYVCSDQSWNFKFIKSYQRGGNFSGS
jgi:hypothetical protein